MYKIDMMINLHIQKMLIATAFVVSLGSVSTASAQEQMPTNPAINTTVNTVCKTGSDVDLPEIKAKIAKMAEDLKSLKQSKQNSRASTSALRAEILAIDQELGPWRVRHKTAAELAGETADTYAAYKTEWIDTGELVRLNDKINLRKTKHQDYKLVRAHYETENAEFVSLGAKYQHIARDLLDRDRDCAAARAALVESPKAALE